MKATNRPAATYVYCVVDNERRLALPRRHRGIPGLGPPRFVEAGLRRWLLVADAPRARFGEAAIARGLGDLDWVARCAVAHASLVESCMRARAVVPVKLFTMFDSDERAVADVARRRRRVNALVRRVAGRAEWGLRIRRAPDAAAASTAPARPRPRSGAQYLAAKSQALGAARSGAAKSRARAEEAFRRLAARAAASVRQALPPGVNGARGEAPLLLDAAFLVNLGQVDRFHAAARRVAGALGPEYRVELSGPWPPYTFVGA